MPGRPAAVLGATSPVAADWRRLLRISRPATWAFTALPFLVAAIDAQGGMSWAIVLGAAYFTLPFNLLRHGVAEVIDGSVPGPGSDASTTRIAIAVTNLPVLVVLVVLGGPAVGLVLLAAVALAIAAVTPPLVLRDRPGPDLATAGLLPVLAALGGLLIGGASPGALPWPAIVALGTWSAASVALTATRDVATGRRATGESLVESIGPRSSATVALVGYAVAVAAVASLGAMGVLTAIGLAAFLLLPPMILVGAGGAAVERRIAGEPEAAAGDLTAAGHGAAADHGAEVRDETGLRDPRWTPRVVAMTERARSDLLGLIVLVGGWLTVLLLQHWGITTYDAWTAAIVVPAALAGYALANVVAIRIATRRRGVSADLQGPNAPVPPVTAVVPCRDAVEWLPATLTALRDQTYADTSIVLVDGGSEDGSPDEAAAWIGDEAVLHAPVAPDGWTDRDWACRVGAMASDSHLVLFVDPGTVLAPITVRVLVEQLEARRLDLLVGVPRDAMPTVGERAAVPGFALLRLGFTPVWWWTVTAGRPTALAFDDGPLLLARRDAYLAATENDPGARGAHAAPGLVGAFAGAGRRIGAIRLATLARTRRYRDAPDVVAGWRRLVMPYGRGWLAGAMGIIALEVAAFLVPLLLPLVAFVSDVDQNVLASSFLPLLLLVLMRLALAVSHRQPPTTILWHPVTVGIALVGQVEGIADHVLGRDGS